MTDELPVVVRGYPGLFPLSRGAIDTPGITLKLDHATPIDVLQTDDPPPAGEMSLSRYLLGLVAGDDRWVGIPVYLIRGFRQRSFWVRRDSDLESLADLKGRTVGLSGWSDTGNTWSRAAMEYHDVTMDEVSWRMGPPIPGYPGQVTLPRGPQSAGGIEMLAPGDNLTDAAIRGDVDAVSLTFPPDYLFEPGAPLRRLVRDYPSAERKYFEQTGVYPAFHILVLRRDAFEANPLRATRLYRAIEDSWRSARTLDRTLGDLTPWLSAELEAADRLLGRAVEPFGVDHPVHAATVEALSTAQVAQRLTTAKLRMPQIFADFLDNADPSEKD